MTTCVTTKDTKKLLTLTQNDSIFYIFQIDIKYNNNQNIKIKRIKNSDVGELINYNDLINTNINKIKISITNFNDPLNIFTIKKSFDENFNGIILLNKKNVFFKIDNNGEYIECKYKILH